MEPASNNQKTIKTQSTSTKNVHTTMEPASNNQKTIKTQSTQTGTTTTKNVHTQVELNLADFILVDYCPRV